MWSLILHGTPGMWHWAWQVGGAKHSSLNGCILFSFSPLHLLRTLYLGTPSAAFPPQPYMPRRQSRQFVGNPNGYLTSPGPLTDV